MSDLYASDYERHLTQFRAHLSGDMGPSPRSSFVPPAGYWTSREKEQFFHALSVHSRLRPDLIADALKSKTVLDVCAYIDALDRAAAAQPLPTSPLRTTLEGAMEVSESWIDYEEEQAVALAKSEPKFEEEAEKARRAELLASRFQDEPAYWSWKTEQERLWKQQDGLAKLGPLHLKLLTSKARESDMYTSAQPPPTTSAVRDGDEYIDPVLLALSAAQPSPPASPHLPSEKHGDTYAMNRLRMRSRRARARGVQPNMDPTVQLPLGRKRTTVYLVKDNRKKRKLKKARQELGTDDEEAESSVPGSPTPSKSDDEDVEPGVKVSYHRGGLTERDKVKSALEDQGITSETLIEWGFDVFNLVGLSKVMNACADPEEYDAGENSVASAVSLGSLKVLRAILYEFTSTIVHRAISHREQELHLKRGMTIWKLCHQDEITSGNVREVLQMHGWNTRNLLTEDDDISSSDDEGVDDADRRRKSMEERLSRDDFAFNHRLPLHRELAPPFARAPETSDDLLPEMDVDQLVAELDDEAQLDELDQGLEAVYEEKLWQTVGMDRDE
ncbi:hypothetical protein C8R46DRAFT_1205425 [Mycena filopes]|nr:hypothetical protein C8R46DRAFT_1205425 [Mycena filopes]